MNLKSLKLYWPELFSLHTQVQANFEQDEIRLSQGQLGLASSSEGYHSSHKVSSVYSGKVTLNSLNEKQKSDFKSLRNRLYQQLQKIMKPWQNYYRPKVNELQNYRYQLRSKITYTKLSFLIQLIL